MRTLPRYTIFLLIAIGLVIGFWSLVTPIFEFPDEQAHFEAVEFLLQNNRMPKGNEYDMTAEMKETQLLLGVFRDNLGVNLVTYHPDYRLEYTNTLIGKYETTIKNLNTIANRDQYVWKEAARYPRLYYDYESLWLRLVQSRDLLTRVFVTRFGSVMIALMCGYIVWQIGYLLFKKTTYANTLTIMVMLQPMYSFLSAGVNSDNLHNLLFFLVILCSLKILKKGMTLPLLLGAILVTTLDIFTKTQGFIALPVIAMAILLRGIQEKHWKLLLYLGGFIGITLIVVAGQWNTYKWLFVTPNVEGVSFAGFLSFSLNKLISQNSVWYWGIFKWLGVVLPPVYWRVANRVVLLGALGTIVYFWKMLRKKKVIVDPYTLTFLFCAVLIYTLAIYWFDWQYNKSIGFSIGVQARYFFPTLVAQMALLFIGILTLGWNMVSRLWLRRGLIALFVWLQLGGIWRLITSYYDTGTFTQLMTELSQYKPWFAKGDWWYLWISLYLMAIIYIAIYPMLRNRSKK